MPEQLVHSLKSADGKQKFFPVADQFLTLPGGYGLPPVEYNVWRGYKQSGATVIDYEVQPRSIQVELNKKAACGIQQYWDERARLVDFLRPNRGGAFLLTLTLPDLTQRSIRVYLESGLEFAPDPSLIVNGSIRERLSFIAYEPFWFDPLTTHIEPAKSDGTAWVLPFQLPFALDIRGGKYDTTAIAYPGTWRAYPTITVYGAYTNVTIYHKQKGIRLQLNVGISTGQRRVITTAPGIASVVDENGITRFGELSHDSDLTGFALYPAPEVPDGLNQIVAYIINPSATTRFVVSFNTQYIGI
ncbi:MAG: phage tail family protein [Chloroflexota bacterium]|nr:phage tail family protein [Chloroflexota bacterium]